MTAAPAPGARPRGGNQRAVGMAMLGSALALATAAVLVVAGTIPFDPDIRPWVAAGVGLAAAVDAAFALYFLRMASHS
jgi:hypothetical protein